MVILWLIPLLVLLLAFFVLPFGVMFYQSLFLSLLQAPAGSPPTLANYAKMFGDVFYVKVLLQTLALGVVVTALTLVIGYPVAYFLARTRSRWRQLLVFLVISPLVVSIVIRSYGWMVLLGRVGTVNTALQALGVVDQPLPLMYNWFGVVVALTHVLLPFMILTLASVIEGIPESLEDTAAVLGAGWWSRFRHVVLPLSMEGVGAGVTLVFMLTIGSFVSVLLLGGSDTLILPLLIYQQVILINNNFAAALGMFLLAISVGLLYVQARAFRVRGAV
jgi:putative spermidine/putrescine transport system permease protein